MPESRQAHSRWLRVRPRIGSSLLVGLPVALNLWLLRGELRAAQYGNDLSVHAAMVRWAGGAVRSGHIPLDDWFPYLTTGIPQFRTYQSFPHLLVGVPAAVVDGDRLLRLSTYLLLALWPVAVYFGARLLDWDRQTAGAAALVSPLLVSVLNQGYEYGSYVWAGSGLWAQLWAMTALPLALGFAWRALERDRSYTPAALALGLTLLSHIITGFFAFLALAVWLYAGPATWARLRRTALLGSAAAATCVWFIIPAAADRAWGATRRANPIPLDSFGARRVLGWLFTGRLFDRGRFPTITVLVFVGLVVCIVRFRKDARARALVCLFALGLLLFFGPGSTGDVLRLIPGSEAVLFERFIVAVHMPGILLAAVGGVFLTTLAVRGSLMARSHLGRVTALVAIAAVVAAWLLPAWRDRAEYAADARSFVETQTRRERADRGNRASLIAMAKDGGGGRIYSGLRTNWGRRYRVGYVPGYVSLLDKDAESIGFTGRTSSILRGIEYKFNEDDPFFYDVFNVRYLLLPNTRQPPVPASLVARRGRHALWSVATSGYFMVVDTVEPIATTRRRFTGQMITFLRSTGAHAGRFPTVAFGGRAAGRPTASRARPPAGKPGSIIGGSSSPEQGLFRAVVRTNRRAALVLKASYLPRWTAIVDGATVRPYLVAPGFPAVTLEPGQHNVELKYRPYRLYPLLFAVLAIAVIGLIWLDYSRRRGPRPATREHRTDVQSREQAKDDRGGNQ